MATAPLDTIRLLCLDADGVLTDGTVLVDDQGVESRRFNVRDGFAIRQWLALGGEIAVISGRGGESLAHRCEGLGIQRVHQSVEDKAAVLESLLSSLGITAEEVAMVGDDLPDLPILRMVGYPIAVADAVPEVLDVAAWTTSRHGGDGAVREVIEHILRGAGRWDEVKARVDPSPAPSHP